MEIIIALVVAAGLVYWFFFRKSEVASVESAPVVDVVAPGGVPYKVPEPAAITPIPLVVETPAPVAQVAPVAEVATVAEVAPVKKPRAPRAPKVVAEVKETAPAKTKKTVAVAKAAPSKSRAKKA